MAKVLIIDDDEHVTRLLQSQLSEEGHHVTISHDGTDGMRQAEQINPDLIMLDVFLPDYTGYQMCGELRKKEATRTTPIIMMTGAARFPNQQMYGRQRGANEYIFKPFNIVEVGEIVHKYIQPNGHAAPQAAAAPEENDDFSSLNSILQRAMEQEISPVEIPSNGHSASFAIQATDPIEPLDVLGQPAKMHSVPAPAPIVPVYTAPVPVVPTPVPARVHVPARQAAASTEDTVPAILASKERFFDFALEIITLASRMTSNRGETYLADQLLRTSLAVGARITESRSSDLRKDSLDLLQEGLKQLRETSYWLMMARKSGSLEALGKPDLEKTCQSLITLLTDFIKSEKKLASR